MPRILSLPVCFERARTPTLSNGRDRRRRRTDWPPWSSGVWHSSLAAEDRGEEFEDVEVAFGGSLVRAGGPLRDRGRLPSVGMDARAQAPPVGALRSGDPHGLRCGGS